MDEKKPKKSAPLVTIIEDSREQRSLDFAPFAPFGVAVERRKLRTGDYSVAGYEHHILIERKSLQDLVGTLTHGRERFLREMYDRGAYVPCKHLVIEASWQEISAAYSFSLANPIAITNSVFSLMNPPTEIHVYANPSRAMLAWYIAEVALNFVRRVTHGSRGLWAAVNAPDAADLAPLPCPYRSI